MRGEGQHAEIPRETEMSEGEEEERAVEEGSGGREERDAEGGEASETWVREMSEGEEEEGEVEEGSGDAEGGEASAEEVEWDGEDCEELEAGRRAVKKVLDPRLPTEEEVKDHYLGCHTPYRSWCHHCVMGRGRERDHRRRSAEDQQGLPEYHMDYCFPGDEFDHKLIVLVVIEKYTKMKKAVIVPSKGSTGSYATRMVMDLIAECGDKDRDIMVKTDQEPAIKFLADDLCVGKTGARNMSSRARGSADLSWILRPNFQVMYFTFQILEAFTRGVRWCPNGVMLRACLLPEACRHKRPFVKCRNE